MLHPNISIQAQRYLKSDVGIENIEPKQPIIILEKSWANVTLSLIQTPAYSTSSLSGLNKLFVYKCKI
jgi:hypothetical protein